LVVSACTTAGIFLGDGALIESCRVHDCTGNYGIFANAGASIMDCAVSYCSVVDGIFVGAGGSLLNCSASNNTATHGINVSSGSTLMNCAASFNKSSASFSTGFNIGSDCTVSHCNAFANASTVVGSTSDQGIGFSMGADGSIQSCTADFNQGDGIRITAYVVVRNNNCVKNGNNGDGAGIHAAQNHNRIEANQVASGDRGIDVDLAGNIIIMNTAAGNTTNYDIVANNVFGAIVDRTAPASAAVLGNSAASSAATTDPWANFSY
jgi:hypothetical protein